MARESIADGTVERIVHGIDLPTSELMTPTLLTWQPTLMHVGDTITLSGDGGIHPSEGATILQFEGLFVTDAPHEEIPIDGLEVVATPTSALNRDTLSLRLSRPATNLSRAW